MARLPVPTAHEIRWGFYLVAVCALSLTLALGWAIVHKVNQSDDLVAIAATSSAQVDRLSDQIDAAAISTATRQQQLRAQNRLLHRQLTTLLRYLRKQGIDVPQTAITPRLGGPTSPKGPTSSGASPSHSPTPSPRPTTGTPSPGGGISAALLCDLLNLSPCPLP